MATVALTPAKPARKASRVWWHVHQWVGLKLALFMSFVCLTGTLAVLSHEIDWLLLPSLRVAPSSVAPGEPNWERIVASAARYPGVASIQNVSEPDHSAFAARVVVKKTDGHLAFLNIHPTTGVVQGMTPWVGAERIFRNLHRHLNLPTKYGVPIVGALGFLLLVSVVTSFVVYKKWWRGFLKAPRRRDARTWWGDLHRLMGVWSLWFVALISVTGIWYFVESLGGDAPTPSVKNVPALKGDAPFVASRFAASLAAARAADPQLRIQGIGFPLPKEGAFVFAGAKTAILVRPRANSVWTDAATGKVLAAYDGRDLNVHQRISEMADPLHFGTFGGYWTKVPWFLFGAMLTALSVSGVAVYALRIGRELKAATPFGIATARIWHGMGRWRWLSAALIATGFAMMYTIFQQ